MYSSVSLGTANLFSPELEQNGLCQSHCLSKCCLFVQKYTPFGIRDPFLHSRESRDEKCVRSDGVWFDNVKRKQDEIFLY